MMSDYIVERETLRGSLAKLKIGLPESEQEISKILPQLLAHSKGGQIAKARKLTAKWT